MATDKSDFIDAYSSESITAFFGEKTLTMKAKTKLGYYLRVLYLINNHLADNGVVVVDDKEMDKSTAIRYCKESALLLTTPDTLTDSQLTF